MDDVGACHLTGDLLVLIAAFCVGAYIPLDAAARAPHTARGGDLSCVVRDPLPAAHLLPAAAGLEWGAWEQGLGPQSPLRCLATAFAFAAWQRGISRIGANRVLVYQYLITVVGVTSGIVFFGETLGINKIAGGVVILLGVYLARRQ